MTTLPSGISIVNSPNASAQLSALQTPEQFAIAREKERRQRWSETAYKFLRSSEQTSKVVYGQAYEPAESPMQEPKGPKVPNVKRVDAVPVNDREKETIRIKFSQKEDRIFVHKINLGTGEKGLIDQLSVQEATLEKAWGTFEEILRVLIPSQVDIIRPSKLDPNTFINRRVGCVTMIMPVKDRYGHAELVFEFMEENRYVTKLAHIKPLGEMAVHASSSAPTDSTEAAIEVIALGEELTELKVFAQTETWLVSTKKITEVICSLNKKQEIEERVPFVRTGRGTLGAPDRGDNCLTYLKYDTLPRLGIYLYSEYETIPEYICPSEEICENSIFSKRKVSVVEVSYSSLVTASSSSLSTGGTRSGFESIDVTREIHEQVLQKAKEDAAKKKKPSEELAAAQRRLSSWKSEQLVYNANEFPFFYGIIDLASVHERAFPISAIPNSLIVGTRVNLIANFSWFPFLGSFVFPALTIPVLRRGEKEKLEIDVSGKVRLEIWFRQMESRIEHVMNEEIEKIKQFSLMAKVKKFGAKKNVEEANTLSNIFIDGTESASLTTNSATTPCFYSLQQQRPMSQQQPLLQIKAANKATSTTEAAPSSSSTVSVSSTKEIRTFAKEEEEESLSSIYGFQGYWRGSDVATPDLIATPDLLGNENEAANKATSTTDSSTSLSSSTSSIDEAIAPAFANKTTEEHSSTTDATPSAEETNRSTFGGNTGIVIKNSPGAIVTSLTQVIVQNPPVKTSKQDVPEESGCSKQRCAKVATVMAITAAATAVGVVAVAGYCIKDFVNATKNTC